MSNPSKIDDLWSSAEKTTFSSEFPSRGDKRPSTNASHGCERCKRAKSSTSSSVVAAEEMTKANKPPVTILGDDCFETILAFLPVYQLVVFRSLSKDTKTKVDEMILKRAPQQPPTLDLKWEYRQDCRQETNRIRMYQGWTEALQDKESVIEFAIFCSLSQASCCQWVIDWVKDSLRKSGSANLDELYDEHELYDDPYRFSCDVEWNDTLEVSTALKRVIKYFQRKETEVKGVSEFHSLRKIVLAKEIALSLLLTNSSNTVSFSRIRLEDYEEEECDGVGDGTILVFRLDNETEIYLNSYFDDDILDSWYNDCRITQKRIKNNKNI